ncbi:MAG TPA: NrfD/PsrC family molybdoenzyme membrane anchor subunit [Candidatus Heimdallarchaeota archaeon]|nr:NrfD/PsrC family molybdoenzyme membrane anchor subunit [Candidatus Heimdallarchaeota archaeon]
MNFIRFIKESFQILIRGSKRYYLWLAFLFVVIFWGSTGYIEQLKQGLLVTNMRDPVSWAFYIGNFTFLVGVAAAAIMLVIPAYIYNWKPLKEVVIFGELLAISAVIMCILFVIVDVGNPLRLWHMIPLIGKLNVPSSLLAWDSVVLTLYFFLNLIIVGYLLYTLFYKREYNRRLLTPLILFSIPVAIGIHTVTAFLYNGFAGRPYWNSALLAPKFLASAFCSGPAVLIILFQILKKTTTFEIKDEAIWKIAELMAYAMFINLFFFFAEVFKEVYSDTEHLVHLKYLFKGVGENRDIVMYGWASLFISFIAFLLFLIPATRKNVVTLNIGAILIWFGVYIEKGIALLIPGFTPDSLGQIYGYRPSLVELKVSMGIFAIGFLIFTFITKIAIAIIFEDFNIESLKRKQPSLSK